jgi:tripartite-type tricarboxylate transporter receptor subunit TctC
MFQRRLERPGRCHFSRALAEQGTTPSAGSPADFTKIIADDTEKWGKVVKFAGIKAE